MNARSNLITAALTLALILPAAASAGSRSIPADAPLSKQSKIHMQIVGGNTSALDLVAYRAWAPYVHGGASQKVAKAITAAAKTHTANVCANTAKYRVPC